MARIVTRKTAGAVAVSGFILVTVGGALAHRSTTPPTAERASATPSAAASPSPSPSRSPSPRHRFVGRRAPSSAQPALSKAKTTPAPVSSVVVPSFANSAALHKQYAHGVGRPGATDHTGGSPVTTFHPSIAVYAAPDLVSPHSGCATRTPGYGHRGCKPVRRTAP